MNWDTALAGPRCLLVPYGREHVPKYHAWMECEWLREMTASERLTLEEEYAMQASWREDPKKCTFIVVARPRDWATPQGAASRDCYANAEMVGDVNMFLDRDDDSMGEMEIMIAEERFRRQGVASEALRMMMRYAMETLGIRRFFCKIGEANEASIALFTHLGYTVCNRVEAFKEVELELVVDAPGVRDVVISSADFMETVPLLSS